MKYPNTVIAITFAALLLSQVVSSRAEVQVAKPTPVEAERARTNVWKTYQTVTLDHLLDFQPQEIPLSQYGGRMDRREKATGFFHVKQLEDRWTLVDPEGYHFINMGVNCVTPADTSPDSIFAFQELYASRKEWTAQTHDLLTGQLYFNSLGRWSDYDLFKEHGRPIPYAIGLSVMGSFAQKKGLHEASYGSTNMKNDVLPVFHEDLPQHIDEVCKQLGKTKDDPWLFGISSDNEIPLFEEDIIKRYLALGDEDPGAKRASQWLRERSKTADDITPEDDRQFCLLVLNKYFKMVSESIKKYAPNHMYLGTRFHKTVLTQRSAYQAAGSYMDIVCINLYHRWNLDQAQLNELASAAGRPIMITEWYAKGIDSGLRNYSGAGFTVRTQEERGMFYENFTISLLRNPHMVGWDWFRYMDDGALRTGRQASNKGLLNEHYDLHKGLTDSVTRINKHAYALRDYLVNTEHPNLPNKPSVVSVLDSKEL